MADVFEQINQMSPSELERRGILKSAKKSGYVCPNCGNGEGNKGDGLTVHNKAGYPRYHCFSCSNDFSAVDLIMMTTGQTAAELATEYRQADTFTFHRQPQQKRLSKVEADTTPKDCSEFYNKAQSRLEDYVAKNGEIRGLPLQLLQEVGAGIATAADLKAIGENVPANSEILILPYNASHFFMRGLNNEVKRGNKGGKASELYTPKGISTDLPLFVTEGQIDALSLIRVCFVNTIATNGAANFKNLPQRLSELNLREKPKVIIIADNDATGKKAAADCVEKLKSSGYRATFFTLSNGTEKVDANKILQAKDGIRILQNKVVKLWEQAESEFEQQERAEMENINAESLVGSLSNVFDKLDDYSSSLTKSLIKTGYPILDKMLPLIPGTYLLGALPSMGKTTFALNIAANICESGTPILYVAYEQGAVDFAFKLLSRYWFMENRHWNEAQRIPTATEMKLGKFNKTFTADEMRRVREELKPKMKNFYVIEGKKETSRELIERMQPYIRAGVKLVVIDYLQRLPNADETQDTRNGINATLADLQAFQKETQTVMLVISSFNRQNYKNFVSFDSFKESGNLEYDADGILGLQYKLEHEKMRADNLAIQTLSKEQPRKIQLVCVKSRDNGRFEVDYKYYSAHDYFKEVAEEEEVDIS